LSRSHLHEMAVSAGFCKRNTKLRPEVFFDMLFYTVSYMECASLSYMVSLLNADFGVSIAKQSLNERFNKKSIAFIKAVLSEVLSDQFTSLYSDSFLPNFPRILIKDSTKFMVPRSLEGSYGSCGGDAHNGLKPSISIQYEYDLKSGKVTDLAITSGDRNDRSDAGETVENIEKNDLIIRDLGYFSTPVLKNFNEKGAYFLSRLDSSTYVYDVDGQLISFADIYKTMQRRRITELEMFVSVGQRTKLPVRMILRIVPDEVYAQRIRDRTQKNKNNGRGDLTKETKMRYRFNIFITNASKEQLALEQCYPLYRLRWQIELHFKIWKSIFKIDIFHEMKKDRYITFLYIKLLMIMINLQIIYCLQVACNQNNGTKIRIISPYKTMKTLKTLFNEIFNMLRETYKKAIEIAEYIQNRLSEHHWLESKKKKLCLPEILELIICISKK